MGIKKGWKDLPYTTMDMGDFMHWKTNLHLEIAVDLLGSFYSQILREERFFLDNTLNSLKGTIYLDGNPTVEKTKALLERTKSLETRLQKFKTMVNSVDGRKSKAVHKKIQKLRLSTKKLPDYSPPSGLQTVNAVGEADVAMAALDRNVVRVSGDSDTLYHYNCRYVARPMRKGKSIQFKVINI
jgi:hypothetical protein